MSKTMMPSICPKRLTWRVAMTPSGIRTGIKKLTIINPIAPNARITNPMTKRRAGDRKLRRLSSRSTKTNGFT